MAEAARGDPLGHRGDGRGGEVERQLSGAVRRRQTPPRDPSALRFDPDPPVLRARDSRIYIPRPPRAKGTPRPRIRAGGRKPQGLRDLGNAILSVPTPYRTAPGPGRPVE
jgi:hypothetical protein